MTARDDELTLTAAHDEALARCEYVIQQRRPWALLAGAAGTGKSALLARLRRRSHSLLHASAAWLDATGADGPRLLQEVASGIGLGLSSRDAVELLSAIRDRLEGHFQCEELRLVLIDHLDAAEPSLIPVLRHLLRMTRGGLTVIAAARTPLTPPLRELDRDFGSVQIELSPLAREESDAYVRGLLRRGGEHERCFDLDAFDALHGLTGGRPRQLDRLCELALLARDVEQADSVSTRLLEAAARELPAYAMETAD